MERIILHIDVNSAFLSWSALKLLKQGYKKDIRNEVSVIAGDPKKRHGVIVAASIPAKKIGIKPPTNLYEARKLYKDIIVVQPDFRFYKLCSNSLIRFLKKIFPSVEQFSIDECFVDYTEIKEKYGEEVPFAYKLKEEIKKRFGFTVNIGIGNNKLSAKMASDFEKPDKVHTLYQKEFQEKMWNKDISELFLAGKSSCRKLRELGINTIGELANYDETILVQKLKSHGKTLHEYANGIDDSPIRIDSYDERKSISYSKTLNVSTDNEENIYACLKEFSEKIERKLKEYNFYSKTLVVTIRDDEFKTISRQEKFQNMTNSGEEIYNFSIELFQKLWDGKKVRLIGLGVTDFEEKYYYQMTFQDNPSFLENGKEE